MKHLVQLILLLTSLNLTAQFQKEWELHLPSEFPSFQPFDLTEGRNLQTYKVGEEEFVTVSIKAKQTGYGAFVQVMRYNSNGNLIWEYIYENNSDYGEWMTDSHVDSENNVLISAATVIGDTILMDGEIIDIFTEYNLLKISEDGLLKWQVNEEFATSCEGITTDEENNIYTIGQKNDPNGNAYSTLFKYDELGNQIFNQQIDERLAFHIELIGEEVFVVTKGSGQNSNRAYRFTKNGDLISEYTIEWLSRKKPTLDIDGNLYVMFSVGRFNLAKYNKEGIQEWIYTKPTNMPDNVFADESISNFVDSEGNIYLTGRFYGENYNTPTYTNCDILTTKIDINGNVLWEDIYNYDNTRSCQIAYKVKVDDDGNTYSVGRQSREKGGDIYGSNDMVLLKYDSQGIRIDSIIYNGEANNEDFGVNIMLDNENIYLIGISHDENSKFRNSIIKYSLLSSTQDVRLDEDIIVYPNPFSDIINIELKYEEDFEIEISNLNGTVLNTTNQSNIDLSELTSGIYFVRIFTRNNGRTVARKVIKI